MRHLSPTATDPAVLVGLDGPDDAAVYRISSDVALVQTVDFFTPIVDDATTWGRIAACNALSDVYAMGGKPLTALNLVGWPRALDLEILGHVLEGGQEICRSAGVSIVGGHSVDDPEPKYGLAVTGTVHPDEIVRTSGATGGSVLVLTKPLGTGIVSAGIKAGSAPAPAVQAAVASMTTLNDRAAEAMLEAGIRTATDVTGFGLVGHLVPMLGTGLDADISLSSVPLLPHVLELASAGVVPGGSRRNRAAAAGHLQAEGIAEAAVDVLCDAQTSGGLLMAVDDASVSRLLNLLEQRGVRGSAIGTLKSGTGKVTVSE